MDYSGTVDYDVNTPFKYEGDDQDHLPASDGVDSVVDDPSKHMPVHHNQDDLIYPPLDFATPTSHAAASSSHVINSQSSLGNNIPSSSMGLDLASNSTVTSASGTIDHILGGTSNAVAMETSGDVAMETSDVRAPSSPESDEIPLAARRQKRPSRSTRSRKSLAEINEEEFDEKPPKGFNLLHDINPALVGTQSIFSSDVQKERRSKLTKGAKKKKKKEPEFCRFCFTNELSLQKIRSAKLPPSSSHPNTKLASLVTSVTDIDLCLSEKWTNPSFQLVCDDCVLVFSQFHEFRSAVQTNDTLLRRLYCSSKAKSKKPPAAAAATPPTAAPVSAATTTTSGKGRRRPNYKDPTSEEDSDARSIVSKKKTRGRRKGVTDDEETDGYLSSVSKTSKKSATSRRGASKKKKAGVTSDEETDGYMSSVSKKSTNTTPAAKSNSRKKRRYNSDSDNEDVKSDVSDGMDFGPSAYAPAENDSSSSAEDAPGRQDSIKQETSAPPLKNYYDGTLGFRPTEDSDIEDDKSGMRQSADGLANVVIKKEASDLEDDVFGDEAENRPSARSKGRPSRTSLELVLKKNLELMTSNVKSKSRMSYLDIICKSLNKPSAEDAVEVNAASLSTGIKTEDAFDDFNDADGPDDSLDNFLPPAKKKRGRKPKSDAEKGTPKRGKREKKKKGAPKATKEKKVKVKREGLSGVEDQSGLDDSDFDPKDFETSAGDDSSSNADYDAFFDQSIEYKCRFCSDQFKSNDKLLRHYKAIHSQTLETSSLCPQCGYTTKSKAMLNRHIRRKHMNITKEKVKQVCEICSAEVYHLAVHKRSLHAGLSFPCPYCGKTFPRKGELQFHIKGIHLKHQLEKTYVCEYCHKEFTFYNYLRRHMRVHTNEKPYKCKDCGVGFNHNVSLKNHMTKCPKREINMSTNSNASSVTVGSAPGRNTGRPVAPGPSRPLAPVVAPTTPTLVAEVAAHPPSVQDSINTALARVTGRFDAPIYYY